MNKQTAKKKIIANCVHWITSAELSYDEFQECLKQIRAQANLHSNRKGRKIPSRLMPDEVERFFAAIDVPKWDLAFRLLHATGTRIDEFRNIKIQHIHLDRAEIEIPAGKGNKRGWVPFDKRLILALKMQMEQSEQYLFESRLGKPYSAVAWQQLTKKYAIKAGFTDDLLKKTTPHIFRHTKATELLEAGMDLLYVRNFLRHVDISTTQIYLSVMSKKLAEKYHSLHNE